MNDAQATILAARTLISNPNHWIRGSLATDNQGRGAFVGEPGACRWCISGALRFVDTNEKNYESARIYLNTAANKMFPTGFKFQGEEYLPGEFNFVDVNDSKDHATVMKMCDLALELAGNK